MGQRSPRARTPRAMAGRVAQTGREVHAWVTTTASAPEVPHPHPGIHRTPRAAAARPTCAPPAAMVCFTVLLLIENGRLRCTCTFTFMCTVVRAGGSFGHNASAGQTR